MGGLPFRKYHLPGHLEKIDAMYWKGQH